MKDKAAVDPQSAFLTVESDPSGEDQCIVHGRAYRNITMGDVLLAAKSTRRSHAVSRFTVTGILAYGRQVESLDRMLTGTLVLRGQQPHMIRPGLMLLYADR